MSWKNYFDGVDDQLALLNNRISREVDLENDPAGHLKMSIVRDAFETIRNAMQSVNTVMAFDVGQ